MSINGCIKMMLCLGKVNKSIVYKYQVSTIIL